MEHPHAPVPVRLECSSDLPNCHSLFVSHVLELYFLDPMYFSVFSHSFWWAMSFIHFLRKAIGGQFCETVHV